MLAVAERVLRERLREGFEVIATSDMYGATGAAALPTVNAIVANWGFGEKSYALAPQLKLYMYWGVRTGDDTIEPGQRRGIPVCHVPDGNVVSVSEHFFALLLALQKRIIPVHRSMTQGEWDPDRFMAMGIGGLSGKTLGLVGFGNIGQAVARRAQGFDMRVLYYRRNRLTPEEEALRGASYAELDDLIAASDVLGIAIPATLETAGLIDRRRLGLMKRGAWFINAARGQVVDQHALLDALNAGRVAGAGLDAFDPEPASPELLPLIRHPNVIASPHIAARSVDEMTHLTEVSAENILRVARGEEPLHRMRVGMYSGYTR
jgi:phosphoglycerate dehydrogenase-like enzyme